MRHKLRRATYVIDEVVLVARAKRGDRDAFGTLYLRYLSGVYRYIYFHIGRRHEDAEDLAQTVLVRAWEALDTYKRAKGRFRVWLFTIAHHALVDYWRAGSRRKTGHLDEHVPDADTPSPEEFFESDDRAREVQKALGRLSAEHKQVVILRHIEGLSFSDIAKITGKRPDAMRALHQRAMKALRELIERS